VPALSRDASARLDDRIAALTGTRGAPLREDEPRSPGVVVAFPRRRRRLQRSQRCASGSFGDGGPSRRRRTRAIATAAAAAAAAVIVAAVLAGSPAGRSGQGPDPDLSRASARNATVLLPDGSAITAHVGLSLPEGAIVTTGPGGHAAAGGVELGPGGEAVVSDGELAPAVPVPPLSAPLPSTLPLPIVPSIPATVPASPLP